MRLYSLIALWCGVFLSSCEVPSVPESSALPAPKRQLINSITHGDILAAVRNGKIVVFIDSREEAEYLEERLPGATRLRLQDVSATTAARFRDADLVIAY